MRIRGALIVASVLLALPALALDDFTFLHLSDVHYPHARDQSAATIAALPRGPIALTPYQVTAPAPAFAIVTGDLNEFSGGNGAWEGYLGLWQDWPRPVYHQLGNHDNTWDCGRPRLRQLYASPFYSFEHGGVRFIGFDTATPQDPRPSLATEGLVWLAQEFAKTPPEQPVIFFCHHPLDGAEFASAYARLRLIELLQTRNVILVLDGHGHGATRRSIGGFDCVMGGSTWGAKHGYGIVSIQSGMLRVCHQFVGDEATMVPLLGKPLAAQSPLCRWGRSCRTRAWSSRARPRSTG
jgi:3',5'-cyclic AMP phosphodiesterase CpdA